MNYIDEAHQTLSNSFHLDKISCHQLSDAMAYFIHAGEKLDTIKKTLFYGKGETVRVLGDLSANYFDPDIIHGIIGIATEAGELIEALFKAMFEGQTFDMVNMGEECGDIMWYQAILARKAGVTFEDWQAVNIAKLRARFPDKFTEYDAQNRDLAAERAILEA